MINSKLLQLYQALDSQELEGFHKWLKSPLHNSDSKLTTFFKLLGSKRKFSVRSVDKKRFFKVLYPHQDYDDLIMRRLMSKGCLQIENFVAFWMSKKETFVQKKYWIEYLNSRQLNKFAQQELSKQQQAYSNTAYRNHTYFYNKYTLEQMHFEQAVLQNRMKTTNLQTLLNQFSAAFVIENLRYACIAVSHENLYKTSYAIPFLNVILDTIEEGTYADSPTIQLYYHAYQTLLPNANIWHFEQLRDNLTAHEEKLPIKEMRNLYMLSINYCIKQINSNESQFFMQQAFDLYQQGLRNKMLLENGLLSRFTYKNIVTLGLRLKQYDWIAYYIPTYANYVEESYRNSYEHYSQSKLYFAQGNYDEAMERLIQIDYQDLFLNLDAKTMLMKIYYETQSWEALEAFLHSFTIFLQRKSILVHHRNNYLNIIKLTRKLMDIIPHHKQAKTSLLKMIQTTQPLTEREWLLEQIEKL